MSLFVHMENGWATLGSSDGNILAKISFCGAALMQWYHTIGGKQHNLIDGFLEANEVAGNMTKGFKSARLSPYVCRLKHGQYHFQGKNYQTSRFFLGPHAIHGLFYDAPFTLTGHQKEEDYCSITLGYAYDGSEKGYPFNLHLKIEYRLLQDGRLELYSTVTNTGSLDCPIGDGWHPYFRLDEPVDKCTLQIHTPYKRAEMDEEIIPNGQLQTDERFEQPFPLKNVKLDDCFALENPDLSHPVATYSSATTDLHIYAGSMYPYLQVYTPDHRESIALENLSSLPDAFNNGQGLRVLSPAQEATFHCAYEVKPRH